MFATIAVLMTLTIAVATFVLLPQLRIERVIYDTMPDRPFAFGYRMTWIAIRARSADVVAEALSLTSTGRSNWQTGIGTVYDEELGRANVFISPPVDGWVFVIGLALPQPLGPGFNDRCLPLLLALSRSFPEVQYYSCHPSLDFFAWAKLTEGRLVRAFAIGDAGIIWNKGRTLKDERSLGLKLSDVRGVKNRKGDAGGELVIYPTEAQVIYLAGRWSLDPTEIETAASQPATGLVCAAAPLWRPERIRRTA